ncbi:hypothetical protein ABRZ04_01740 [Castellaniella ginsengisoli]|uniref:Uncharacterized protein n=1 Tax=Castellaniella ginsengisoli TaxID=546114 RepID=A0AB39D4R3_9BURK
MPVLSETGFQLIPKAVVLDAVGEYASEHVSRPAKLKKAGIASATGRLDNPAIFLASTVSRRTEQGQN